MLRFKKLSTVGLVVIVMIAFGLSTLSAQDVMTGAHKAMVMRVIEEAFNSGNVDVIDEVYAADAMTHNADGTTETGTEAFKQFIQGFRAAMPDYHAAAYPLVAQGEYVAFRFMLSGTFENELLQPNGSAIPPTGMPVTAYANVLLRFDEQGQVVEEWDAADNLALLIGLGVFPAPEGAEAAMIDEIMPEGDDVTVSGMEQDHADTALRVIEDIINQGDLALADEIFGEGFTHREGGAAYDIEGWKAVLMTFRSAMPDLNLSPEIVVAEGNYVMVYYILRGTHTGDLPMPDGSVLPPTNAEIELPSMILIRFNDAGQVIDTWDEFDNVTLLAQLGLLEAE